jgi:toxin FitB
MSYLVDTNIYSAVIRERPDPAIESWLERYQADLYTSSITIAELARGVQRLPQSRRRAKITAGLDALIESMDDRILRFDTRAALTWAELYSRLERAGILLPLAGSYIAAIAKRHNLTVASGDTKDFGRAGVRTINPFEG